jgi:hypothetical protein
MKLLINDKELVYFLCSQIDHLPALKSLYYDETEIEIVKGYIANEKSKKKFNLDKMRHKLKNKIYRGVERSAKTHYIKAKQELEDRKGYYYKHIRDNLKYFVDKIGEEKLLKLYYNSDKQNFVKTVGFQIKKSAEFIRRDKFTDYTVDCLIRNTVGNENLLLQKINHNQPFWFIDSGYTNFIETSKKWHRIERNHMHYGNTFEAPVDRLGVFKQFPQQWRNSGDTILVIEPGAFAANILGVNLNTWRYEVESELRKYTDKKIVFREKFPKKTRPNLYKELCNNDYYCLININSNAATEAIWAGVPVITLDKHITNPVTANSLSDINSLKRPNLSAWLCMLSYSQFTYDELIDGTALKLVKKYHV